MTNSKDDQLPQETIYGKSWTWNPNVCDPQKNLEGFLSLLAKDSILQAKVSEVKSKDEVVQLGKDYGFEFNSETLESRTETLAVLSDSDFVNYTWGRWGDDGAQRWALLAWKKL